MSWKIIIAFVCHFLATLPIAFLGITYIIWPTFMPYHAVAVGMPWSAVPPGFQVLTLALMRAVGFAALAVFVLELFLLLFPFRHGAIWAKLAIPAGGLIISFGALYAMVYVSLNTPATPPWMAPAASALLFVVGLIFSFI